MQLTTGGIDEAGLGPKLGPYCAFLTVFEWPEKISPYEYLKGTISRNLNESGIIVTDSKKVFDRTPRGMKNLERSVLSFYSVLKDLPASFLNLLKDFLPREDVEAISRQEWYSDLETSKWPLKNTPEHIRETSTALKAMLQKKACRIKTITGRVITASVFNDLLLLTNKGGACQTILTPLIRQGVHSADILTVDRQGGRKFYGEWLLNIFQGQPLRILHERPEESAYLVTRQETVLKFLPKADTHSFETALSSLFAKYIREVLMQSFNRFWISKYPELKPTAGYPQDAVRFINDLKKYGLKSENIQNLVRWK